jgi:glutathione S-transferase
LAGQFTGACPAAQGVGKPTASRHNRLAMSETYVLYHYPSCGFCARVRRFLDEAGIAIELRNIHSDPQALFDLANGGGRTTVPCLRIQRDGAVEWLYESLDIIDYLRSRLAAASG